MGVNAGVGNPQIGGQYVSTFTMDHMPMVAVMPEFTTGPMAWAMQMCPREPFYPVGYTNVVLTISAQGIGHIIGTGTNATTSGGVIVSGDIRLSIDGGGEVTWQLTNIRER